MENLPWGTNSELKNEEFYNRKSEILYIKQLLETTSNGTPPTMILPGIRGVGKTVLLKKIKNEIESDYLVSYIDLTNIYSYQMGKLDEIGLVQYMYKSLMESAKEKKFKTLIEKTKNYFKLNKFKISNVVEIGGYPVPIPETEEDADALINYVLKLPQKLYERHKDEIKGVIIIIDEFQALNDLGEKLDGFLWFFRSIIQKQRNVAYVFSGSLSSKDTIIEKIAGERGAFGGRMLSIEITPFSKETVKKYLNERAPLLKFDDGGFERFYKCTKGIPYYVNIFANLLQKNTELDEDKVKKEFEKTLPILADHLKQKWGELTLNEQKILVIMINGSSKRKEIAEKLNKTSGSLGVYLNNLQKKNLIENNNKGVYKISEPILKYWLKQEYENNGIFPFRSD